MTIAVVYNIDNGRIDQVLTLPSSMLEYNVQGKHYVESEFVCDSSTHYVDVENNSIKERTPLELYLNIDTTTITSDGVSTATISNIPDDVFVRWPDGIQEEVLDGIVEFSTNYAGHYDLIFSSVKYLHKRVTIEATI